MVVLVDAVPCDEDDVRILCINRTDQLFIVFPKALAMDIRKLYNACAVKAFRDTVAFIVIIGCGKL